MKKPFPIRNANEICSVITEEIALSHPVYLTDGTVTRDVVKVECTERSFNNTATLDVLLKDGDESNKWVQIAICPISLPAAGAAAPESRGLLFYINAVGSPPGVDYNR